MKLPQGAILSDRLLLGVLLKSNQNLNPKKHYFGNVSVLVYQHNLSVWKQNVFSPLDVFFAIQLYLF